MPQHPSADEWHLACRVLLPGQVSAVKTARDHAACLVMAHGLGSLLDDTVMVTSEIVTNAIVHGSPAGLPVLLEAEVAASALRVSVLDYSDQLPVLRQWAPGSAESGRGLNLIDALAKSWGGHACHAYGFRKVVWAELA